ncbi:hypothetical protein FHG87_018414 [Trinorchestia longiramus]|nr:hypothetical protein FHG87_018414 [Trinorchestia longiramus]
MKCRGWKPFLTAVLLGWILLYTYTVTQNSHSYMVSLVQHRVLDVQEEEIKARMQGPISYDDPALLDLIRSKYLDPPSSEPYNLTEDEIYNQYKSMGIYVTAMHVVRHYFRNITGGTFVEAGALDGQFLSNTLDLEKDQGWTGLLVEAGEMKYKNILQRHRRAWVSHSCLALHPYPHTAILGTSVISEPVWTLVRKGQAALLDSRTSEERLQGDLVSYEGVQCLPVASLLLALNITAVDFFSLDVEDVEEAIIDSFPFDRISVDVWYIEHRLSNVSLKILVKEQKLDMAFIERFWKKGYTYYRTNADYLFVRNGSKYSELPPIKQVTVVQKTELVYTVQYFDTPTVPP